MKVLYCHQHFSTPQGATGTRSYEIAQRLIARGHQVTMVTGSAKTSKTGLTGEPVRGIRRGMVDGIDVIEICLPYSNYDGFVKRACTFLRFAWKSIFIAWREKYDLLFATSTPLTASIPGIAMRLFKPRKKFVFEVRDLWPEIPKAMGVVSNPLMLFGMSVLEKISYMAMNAGVGLSPGIREGMRRRSAVKKPIEMVPNGCDLKDFIPRDSAEADDVKLPEGFPTSGFRCAFTGAHGTANGLDAVLDAAAVLKKRGRTDIHFVFIGDGKIKPRLKERAECEGLSMCHFIDPVPKPQLAKLMRHIDVGLMVLANVPAFYYGTSPNKFFDYIATGLPVLNNYPGWLAGLIQENRCGVVIPPDAPEAFADALTGLADKPEQLPEMGRNGRCLAERMFDRDLLANHLIDFLEQIVAGTAAAAKDESSPALRETTRNASVVSLQDSLESLPRIS